jgi:hypothetical protein
MAWWSKNSSIRVSEADKQELELVSRAAEMQKVEARSLLADAKIIGDKCRESRRRNHYRLVLDSIFEGGKP